MIKHPARKFFALDKSSPIAAGSSKTSIQELWLKEASEILFELEGLCSEECEFGNVEYALVGDVALFARCGHEVSSTTHGSALQKLHIVILKDPTGRAIALAERYKAGYRDSDYVTPIEFDFANRWTRSRTIPHIDTSTYESGSFRFRDQEVMLPDFVLDVEPLLIKTDGGHFLATRSFSLSTLIHLYFLHNLCLRKRDKKKVYAAMRHSYKYGDIAFIQRALSLEERQYVHAFLWGVREQYPVAAWFFRIRRAVHDIIWARMPARVREYIQRRWSKIVND